MCLYTHASPSGVAGGDHAVPGGHSGMEHLLHRWAVHAQSVWVVGVGVGACACMQLWGRGVVLCCVLSSIMLDCVSEWYRAGQPPVGSLTAF